MPKDEAEILREAGGRAMLPKGVQGIKEVAPEDVKWNFGVKDQPASLKALIRSKPSVYQRFPNLEGAWDGKTSINHWDTVQKVLKNKGEELIQQQPRGTCGGRSGSAASDWLQCILIGAGKRAKFKRTSHAALYFTARKIYEMLEGSWTNDNYDGVASGAIPEAMVKFGLNTREEIGDEAYYGEGSDDLACKLGAGMLPEIQKKIIELGADNLVTEWAPVNSAQEAADGMMGGGILIGSDDQGFSMTRDSNGCCSPRGTWYHYHIRVGLEPDDRKKGLWPYWQSWGKTVPGGPRFKNYPGNVFGVDWDVQDRCIRRGDYAILFGFPLWDLEQGPIDIPWIFK